MGHLWVRTKLGVAGVGYGPQPKEKNIIIFFFFGLLEEPTKFFGIWPLPIPLASSLPAGQVS